MSSVSPKPAPAQDGPPEPPAFHAPLQLGQSEAPNGADVWTGLSYAAPNGFRELELEVYVPTSRTGAVPLVIWIHGGAWLFGSRKFPPEYWPQGALFQKIIDAGLAVATIEYRHSREAAFPAQLHDAKAAVRYLREFASTFGIDPDRIGVWGESAGGHLAALVAFVGSDDPQLEGNEGVTGGSSAVKALVDFYGVSDIASMPDFLETMPPEYVEELTRAANGTPASPMDVLLHESPFPAGTREATASPISYVSASAPPVLMIHGTADTVVPFDQSERLLARLTEMGADAELIPVPGADHVFLGADPVPLLDEGVAFLVAHL